MPLRDTRTDNNRLFHIAATIACALTATLVIKGIARPRRCPLAAHHTIQARITTMSIAICGRCDVRDPHALPTRAAAMIEPVSADCLRKTGICADTAGDFRRFAPQLRRTRSSETKPNAGKAGISGPFLGSLGKVGRSQDCMAGAAGIESSIPYFG